MALSLTPLAALLPWRRKAPHAEKLYGAIVAQARLPIFYQQFGVPDSLDGRFLMLSLHLFAVLHRLKDADPDAAPIAQDLADLFTADMETVLRELGVGDLSVPKKVRKLIATGAGQFKDFERALGQGEGAFAAAIAAALPDKDGIDAKAASAQLTPYVLQMIQSLEAQHIQTIRAGALRFPQKIERR